MKSGKKVSSRHAKLLLSVWQRLPAEQKKDYKTLPKLKRLVSSSVHGRQMTTCAEAAEKQCEEYCDEPPTASLLDPRFIGKMSAVAYQLHVTPSCVEYDLFVGDFRAANDQSLLTTNSIYAILSLGGNNTPTTYPSVHGGYLVIDVKDNRDSQLNQVYEEVHRFISSRILRGNVLVHDFRGRNRCVAVVLYFMIRQFTMSFAQALQIVTESTEGYAKLTRNFEKQLKYVDRRINKL